jgi:sec-independent protein translocase protein TatA
MANLFDSPWKVLLVAVVLIVLFGSKKLPDAARSLGKSMRILKTEVSELHHDESDVPAQNAPAPNAGTQSPPAQLTSAPAPVPVEQQSQIDALQQQIRDLQRASAMDTPPAMPSRGDLGGSSPQVSTAAVPEPQRTQPS